MKIFAATLTTETNTFAAIPTSKVDFEAGEWHRQDGSVKGASGWGVFHAELRRLAESDGHSLVESIVAFAYPSGPTIRAVYEEYRDFILEDLRAAMPVDAVQLYLHGAMVAIGYDDCEGDLISEVRKIVGKDTPIGVELDLHCHFTEAMRLNADIIISYKEYPHTDTLDRLRELYGLTLRAARKEIKPVTAAFDCRMIGLWHTTSEPMKSFVKRMQSFEGKNDVLSVSLGHGFAHGDVADVGAKIWIVADGDGQKAAMLAETLGREFWALRQKSSAPPLSLPVAIERLGAATNGPIVVADVSDNPGGGAMGDSTFVLRELLDSGIDNVVSGCYWDPGAVILCKSAGVGATLDLRIGGKCGPMSGNPIDLRVTIRAIVEDHAQTGLGIRFPLGTGVWVEAANGVDIVLISNRSQVMAREAFEGLGIVLKEKSVIVVKSAQHFFASFAPIASEVLYVGAPGTTAKNFETIPYTKRALNYWPRVSDPWAVDSR